jgi:hypothetical protein
MANEDSGSYKVSVELINEYARILAPHLAAFQAFLADPVGKLWNSHRQAVEHVAKAQQETRTLVYPVMKDGQISFESTDPSELEGFSEIIKSESQFAAMYYQRLVDAIAAFNEAGWPGDCVRPPTVAAINERATFLDRERGGIAYRSPEHPRVIELEAEVVRLWSLADRISVICGS